MNKKIGIFGIHIGWIIQTNCGPIHFDKNGDWYLGGGDTAIALFFQDRKRAIRVAKKIKKQRPDLIKWTKTLPVHYSVEDKK